MTTATLSRRGALCGITAAAVSAAIGPVNAASLEALFAPSASLWPRWQAHARGSTRRVGHGVWDHLLKTYASAGPDGINRFAYGRVSAADRTQLVAYLDDLAATPVDLLDRPAQFAFWVNLYNALTVKVILDHYPVASIRDVDISPGLFARGPWDAPLIGVEGERLTLNDIEHRILRPIWRDPRLHYAVNCASLGCPNLQREAFTSSTNETLLEAAARAYVNHPRGAALADDGLTVSSIYIWFKEDFGGSDAGVIAHLRRYAAPDLTNRLAGVTTIAGDRYDWRLNDAGDGAA